MKKICSILLILCMLSPLLADRASAAEVASGTCGNNVKWMLDSAGVLSIKGTGDMVEYESMRDVPWYDHLKDITNAVISSGVSSIAPYSFWMATNLQSVSIPEGVTKIGHTCFMRCENLTQINLPNSLQEIGGPDRKFCVKADILQCKNQEQK